MKKWLGGQIEKHLGYTVTKKGKPKSLPPDFDPIHSAIYDKVKHNTMTSPERIYSLLEAVRYIETNQIPGAIVECGVWKGGSMMSVAEMLLHLGKPSRELYLYDTFEGMSAPEEIDKTYAGQSATELLAKDSNKERNDVWAYSTLETVQKGMHSTGYPQEKIHYVKGKVEDTIPSAIPSQIAILRLDTDWYESTRHELVHLYPLLSKAGVLILDDYGHWAGARKAVDEYFAEHKQPLLLNRIDETGRIAVKQIG
ncbi:MAG TPA: TylF/MycF/NovP-related O-methyltransferase [Puia sp.]|nr:TylF/MycF/NovP-related O-methyltransferase [Puia sp.]